MMPPTRLQWASVKIANKPPSPGDKDNTIVFFPGGNISVYWGSFKNARAFHQKPVEHKIESPELKVILTSYRQHLVGVNFFPRLNTKKSAQISQSQLGAILGDITHKLTGRRFTVLRMRASYITNYHKQLALEGKTVDINALDKIMFSMLQTDIKTHLGYSKRSQEGWGSVVLNKQSDVIYKETHQEDD